MDPEQSVKGTKKAEGSPRKRLTKGEAIQTSVSSSAPEGSQEKTGQPQNPPKRSSIEASVHISQIPQHPLTPAFIPGLHPQGQLLPSHASVIPPEDLPGIPKVFVPRPSQVSLKPTEEAHKKERKPQKPGKYICQYCSRPCAKPSVLQKHIRSHTGERPYPCGPCGFSFKTKSNLYKHRKSHAHRIKAGLASGMGGEMYPPGLEMERIPGEEFEEPTEGESTDSEEETGSTSTHPAELSPRPKHPLLSSGLYSSGSQGSSHERCSLSHERKKVIDEQAFLSPGSKGSTESGYFSRSESAEQQVSPPNTNARSYAEIIFGNEIDSVKPRRSSLSRRSSMESPKSSLYREPLSSHSEKTKPEQSLLSLQHPPSTTPPVPLLRSHSMPSATCTLSTPPHTFRGSYSFDDHVADSEALSRSSQLFTSHPRMLKRQPAIELPLGGEDNYEAHKKYYCSELQMAKPVTAGAHASPEAEKSQAEHEPWSQMMHYKLGSTLELTPLRKRRKEKSLGDEEEPPAFEATESQFSSPGPSEAARSLPLESTKSPAEPSKSVPSLEGSAGFQPRTPKPGSSSESGKERRTTSKEISPEPPPKEPEKTEEFQWPQRSQTLAQLPAEKLPPKKKRLRLAEMAQSSGESSFESSMPLSRSPSQESSVSLSGSSRSASFERDDHGKAEAAGPSSDTRSKPLGTHMLTVPSHHPHTREMRRSASEQSPNVSHSTHMTETRSKSFDYGSLSLTGPSAPAPAAPAAPAASAAPPERRKCFLVRQASLSRPPETEPEATHKGRQESEEPKPSSKALQVFPHPIAQLPLQEKPYLPPPVSLFSFQHLLQHEPGQSSEFFSTQAMSSLLSTPYAMPPLPPSLFQAPPLPLQPTVLHPGQLHLPQLMPHPANIPFRQPPSFLPMPYPASSALSSGFFLPLQSQFALQLPGDVESHVPQIKTSLATLATGTPGLSPSTEYSSDIQLPPVALPSSCSAPTSAPPLALPACPDTMILVTQSQGSSATVALPKFEEPSCKGTTVCGADVYEVGPRPAGVSEEQSRGFPTPYLRVPVTLPERKGTSLSSESVLSLEGSSSTVGGSKRVLSPAGSLELTMETQQQKRVKEEEASKADEKLELVKPCSVVLSGTEDSKRLEKSHLGSQGQGRREVETLSSLSSDPSDPKEIPPLPQPSLPRVTTPGSEALKEYAQPSGKPHRRGLLPLSVKKEDSKEQPDLPPLAPLSSQPLSETSPRPAKLQEGTDSKKVLQFPSLHTTTNVSWCYLNYIKPNHIQHADRRSSVYAGWCISLYNPNLPGVSTKAALSLLRSKQKVSKETYTMATAPHPETGRLVPSSSRKPRMTEVRLPSLVSPEGQKEIARVEKEEEKRGKPEEDAPASKRGEPARIKIFEG
ncbi:hypothetical protein E2I00_001180, partial [Balaenoptera physalus]